MSKPLKGASFLSLIMDEMVDEAKNMMPIPTYNIHHVKGSKLVFCSARGAGKTRMMLDFYTLIRVTNWKVRVKHHSAPVKVQFT